MLHLAQRIVITQQRHDIAVTFPNLERAGLIGNPASGKSVDDCLVLPHLIHDLARHFSDQRDQQRLREVLKARLHNQFDRTVGPKCVLPDGI